MVQIGKKYWHPEFGYVTYEGTDYLTGKYHLVSVRDEGVTTVVPIFSTKNLFTNEQKREYLKTHDTRWASAHRDSGSVVTGL